MHRCLRALFPALLLLELVPNRIAALDPKLPAADRLCFPAVPGVVDCIDPRFRQFWEQNGGLPVFGYPRSPALPEETPDGLRIAQHFERNRLEHHPEAPEPHRVQLGRLGADRLAQLGRSPIPRAEPESGCRFFPETGHNLCGAFLAHWREYGLEIGDPGVSERESIALFGLPLTEMQIERNASGDTVPTQWFERARLEDHSQRLGGTAILQGLLDLELDAAFQPATPDAGWVTVADRMLIQQGRPIMLKGLNYYPAAHPWGHMWREWDGPVIAQELGRARRELGINVVRILVPYRRSEGWMDDYGNVSPFMLDRLRQLVQIAGQQQLKVILTLFDWHDGVAPAGSAAEQAELRYLRTIVESFKDDDRIIAWDLHNEPDAYPSWKQGAAPAVVDWLWRMGLALRQIDRRHLLTVGVSNPASVWQADGQGRTIAALSDMISVHSFDAASLPTMIAAVAARTSKPVLLEEFGWPSGPECRGAYYDEASQLYFYRMAMRASTTPGLVGMLSWWFQDPPATMSYAADENGHFGLYRRTAEPKPAVGPYRNLRVPALPSRTQSDLPLTVVPPPVLPPHKAPLIFDDGLVVRDAFRSFWNSLGGEEVLGRPLTQAYKDSRGILVQYFQHVRFELNEGSDAELYPVRLTPLGAQRLAGRSIERVPDPGRPDVRYFPRTGHTLSGGFLALWETRGEDVFGPPISEVFVENVGGRPARVQYFEAWRFEQEGDGPVRLADLGAEALTTRECPRPVSAAGTGPAGLMP